MVFIQAIDASGCTALSCSNNATVQDVLSAVDRLWPDSRPQLKFIFNDVEVAILQKYNAVRALGV